MKKKVKLEDAKGSVVLRREEIDGDIPEDWLEIIQVYMSPNGYLCGIDEVWAKWALEDPKRIEDIFNGIRMTLEAAKEQRQ